MEANCKLQDATLVCRWCVAMKSVVKEQYEIKEMLTIQSSLIQS
jgi:hypothetical protein